MSQNSERLSWTFEEVDQKLKDIMTNIYQNISRAAKEYGHEDDFVLGANVAGFKKSQRRWKRKEFINKERVFVKINF